MNDPPRLQPEPEPRPPAPVEEALLKNPEALMRCARRVGQARITTVEWINYQPPEGKTLPIETRCCDNLASDEQPYVRQMKLTSAWKPLDTGWIEPEDGASLLVLKNEGEHLVEITCVPGADALTDWVLPTGRTMRVFPADLTRIRLRSIADGGRCTVYLFPK